MSGLGHTSKGLPEATLGCEVLLRGHSGRWAAGFVTIKLPAIGKAQSPYGIVAMPPFQPAWLERQAGFLLHGHPGSPEGVAKEMENVAKDGQKL